MLLSPKKTDTTLHWDIVNNKKPLKQVNCTKILGVLIDNKLTFKQHTTKLTKSLRKYLPILSKLKHCLPFKELMKIYYALIHSVLTYCILIYKKGNETNNKKLFRIQKRILKIIHNTNSDKIMECMTKSKVLNLDNAYNFKLLKLAHKIVFDKVNIPYFLKNVYKPKKMQNLRNKDDFDTPYCRTNIGQRTISYSISNLWNELPYEIKSEKNIRIFVRKMKRCSPQENISSYNPTQKKVCNQK